MRQAINLTYPNGTAMVIVIAVWSVDVEVGKPQVLLC